MKEELEADRIIEMFSKGIKEKAVLSNPVKFAAVQCALLHVEGLIDNDMTVLVWLENIKASKKVIHGMKRNIDFHNNIKQIIQSK